MSISAQATGSSSIHAWTRRAREIPVLNYLGQMGVDVSTQVKLVVGTHAHDDHIAGLSKVLGACNNATFVWSSALTKESSSLISKRTKISSVCSASRSVLNIAKSSI